ncbi:hypothetical protein GCM10009557_46680 [Virgisporangium ochraceum]|uniref:Secreted protein n=1 Tax=Virgisporangium ochraceum TaxID=65505 RepID=A0A8J4A7X8_9ACTN|nr:hypothetical protein [Virgisporangium ochraceum]GIJ75540.1 hypothetical protein Voc01_104570 [Virgisporangium ochraceum]
MRKQMVRAFAGALAVLVLTALAAAPAQARPQSTERLTSVATTSTIIDPTTGAEIIVAFQIDAAAMAAARSAMAATEEGCRTVTSYYIIYFSIPYYRELLRWKFRHSWCWELRSVNQVTTSEARVAKDPTIKMTGTWNKSTGRVPAAVVETKFQGMNFQYCPIVGAAVACFGQFDPIIDVDLSWRGAYIDHTQLG